MNYDHNEKFNIIRILDDWRWENEDKDFFNSYSFKREIRENNEELTFKILLAHYLIYICDRQMDYRYIFKYGGYVITKIMEEYLYKPPINDQEFEKFVNNHTYEKKYLKADIQKENDLYDLFDKKNLIIKDEEKEYAIFASRMTLIDYFSIFKTLHENKSFADALNNSETIKSMAEKLYDISYKDITTYKGNKEYIKIEDYNNFYEIYKAIEKIHKTRAENNTKTFEDNKYASKRLWCVLRDYLYYKPLSKYFKKYIGEDKFKKLYGTKEEIELPGDVWNNNSEFALCFWGEQNKNFKSSKFTGKEYKNNKGKWNGCIPVQFDITFNYVPNMCDVDNCMQCPLIKYSENEKIKEKFDKEILKQMCHEQIGKYCTFALYAAGLKHKCKSGCELRKYFIN